MPTLTQCLPKKKPSFKPTGIDHCDQRTLDRWAAAEWAYPPYQVLRKHLIRDGEELRVMNSEE
eukprot:8837106-Karenia_brevis.AAC.1